jgi:hypothetical protein
MRFMMIVKGSAASEAGVMPTAEQFAEMDAYNEQLRAAGVLVDLAGLKATSTGARVNFAGGTPKLTPGPFTDGNITSGFWIIDVKDAEEAFAWAMKAPNPAFNDREGEIEVRPFFEASDFE